MYFFCVVSDQNLTSIVQLSGKRFQIPFLNQKTDRDEWNYYASALENNIKFWPKAIHSSGQTFLLWKLEKSNFETLWERYPGLQNCIFSPYNFETRKKRNEARELRNGERIESGGKGRKAKLAKEILFARKVIQWAYQISFTTMKVRTKINWKIMKAWRKTSRVNPAITIWKTKNITSFSVCRRSAALEFENQIRILTRLNDVLMNWPFAWI